MTSANISPRLDTRLYSYDEREDEIRVNERYAVMGTPVLNSVGTWSRGTGRLAIPESNIWERRTDLRGAVVTVASIHIPLLHELYYDESESEVIGGGGFFLEPLNYLSKKLNFTLKLKASGWPSGSSKALKISGYYLVHFSSRKCSVSCL